MKPWKAGHDRVAGDIYNCVFFRPKQPQKKSWDEWQCANSNVDVGCPCTYQTAPILRLRGFCPGTHLDTRFTVTQLATAPQEIIIMGPFNNRIQYNSTLKQWVLTHLDRNVTARSRASLNSYLLGKHNWTISGDEENYECSEGKEYSLEMKLTGCKPPLMSMVLQWFLVLKTIGSNGFPIGFGLKTIGTNGFSMVL